jgi:hypothetical protein
MNARLQVAQQGGIMSRNGFRLTATTALAAAFALGLLAIASADVEEVKSSVKIDSGGPEGAEGHVSSPDPDCEKGREVTLFAVPSERGVPGGVPVGSDKTNKKGKWEVKADLFAGDYVAEVAAKTINNKLKHPRTKCKSKKSKRKRL